MDREAAEDKEDDSTARRCGAETLRKRQREA
jgi:hypothetical protein